VTETESTRTLQASLALSASLLEAPDDESVLRAAMRAGCDELGADGCLFMPFDEFSQRLSPLEFGRVPLFDARLMSDPARRQKCKTCETRNAGRECALLHCDPDSNFIHCIPLRARGREAGLFSFVFSSEPRVDESREWFLSDTTINRDEFLNRFMEGESPMQVVLVSLGSTEPVVLYQRKRLTAEQAESWLLNPWG
jgi:hypothetical protein